MVFCFFIAIGIQKDAYKCTSNFLNDEIHMNISKTNTVIQQTLATTGNPKSNQERRIPMISAQPPEIGTLKNCFSMLRFHSD